MGAAGTGGGVTVRLALRATPSVPVITAVVFVETALVLTAKVALVAPAATVTLGRHGGRRMVARQRDRRAARGRDAAQRHGCRVEALPLTTVVGLSEIAESVTDGGVPVGVTVRVAVPRTPP